MIYAVFWRGVPSQDAAAGTMRAPSRFTSSQESSRLRREGTGSQTINDQRTVDFKFVKQQHFPYPLYISASYGKPASPLHPQLAMYNRRSVSPASSKWLQAGVSIPSSLRSTTIDFRNWQGRPDRRGGPETTEEGCYKSSSQLPWSVPQSYFPGTQEGRIIQTGSQLEATELIYGKCTFQDGEPGNDERPVRGKRLDGLKDTYLSVAIWEEHWKYLRLPCQGKVYKF